MAIDNSLLARLLRQRGHDIVSEGYSKDILVPRANEDSAVMQGFEDILYNLMRRETFRKSFRNWAYGNKVSDEYLELIKSYITLGTAFDKDFIDIESSANMKIQKYSHTFEWYVSQIFLREFGARAAGFNIRLKDADPDDDFDCIALVDNGLVFVECKTGKAALYSEIEKFVRRDGELAATHSFFIFDRDYTFTKSKQDIPNIKKSKANEIGLDSLSKITIGRSGFYNATGGGRSFLVTTGYAGLETRLRHMMRYTTMYLEGSGTYMKVYDPQMMEFADDLVPSENVPLT